MSTVEGLGANSWFTRCVVWKLLLLALPAHVQELSVQLLTKQIEDPAWNQSFARYFESLPAWGTLYSKEIWRQDPDHLALLQEPYLVIASLHRFHVVEYELKQVVHPKPR